MGQWKDLPYVQIVQKLKYYYGSWRSANKEMYSILQSLDFECVSVKVGNANDKRLSTILNSCFSPGQWVKDLTLEGLSTPDRLHTIDPANDPLLSIDQMHS